MTDKPQDYEKELPRISVYVTAKELRELLERTEGSSRAVEPGETLKEIRVEGRISYHDLLRLKKIEDQ